MAEPERAQLVYAHDMTSGDIIRKRQTKDTVLEERVVANFNADTQTLTFKDGRDIKLYKIEVTTFLAQDEKTVRYFQRGDIEADKPLAKNVPNRPKKNPLLGDKTPAVVEWYQKYRWNEFCTRYGFLGYFTGETKVKQTVWEVFHDGRHIGGTKQGELEARGNELVIEQVVEAIVTLRKTHVSYTPDECEGFAEDEEQTEFNSRARDDDEVPNEPATAGRGAKK